VETGDDINDIFGGDNKIYSYRGRDLNYGRLTGENSKSGFDKDRNSIGYNNDHIRSGSEELELW
jgi:hypothetical protein